MAEPGGERRLAAIVAIDVAGYSRLMGTDEVGTLATLKAHRAVIDPISEKHGGRIVGTAGDGFLLEFPSVVAAVTFAVETQGVMADRNAGIADDLKMLYRIGINLGDVLVDGEDIYGDGVNVAARIEALAEPGGVCVSRTVRDNVRDKLDIAFDDMGEVEVKNIARPVRVFRVLREGETAATAARHRPSPRIIAAAAALAIAIAVSGVWWWQAQPDFEPADPAKMAYALPEKPSIAVLPFDNLSGDPAQDYLGDGLTENIITVLSTSPNLFVIARNSSFTFKGKAVRVQEVAERLGVRYVLEGSVQREGERLRVTAQLIDAVDGRHLWAERYDRDLNSLFELQDDITQRILVEMQVQLTLGDQARLIHESVADPEVYRLVTQGLARFLIWSPEAHEDAERLWTEVSERRPDGALSNNLMGWVHWQKVFLGLSKDPAKSLAKARDFAERALSINEESGPTHALLATLDVYAKSFESAIAHADRVIELRPTDGGNVAIAAWAKLCCGQPQEGIELLERAMRLEPYGREWVPGFLAFGHLMLGNYDEAREISQAQLATPADDVSVHPWAVERLTVIAVFEGDVDRARRHVERLSKIEPKSSVSSIRNRLYYWKDQAFLERYLDALRTAGLPDFEPVSPASMAYALPEKPSIAVLPFDNLSGDPEQDYLGDGLTENIIAVLSTSPDLFVIARNSSFTYKGKATRVQDVAEQLGVRYVMEGSVQQAGDRVRVTAQLVDAIDGRHLWAERYDRELNDLKDAFAIQDDITQKILLAMHVELLSGDSARRVWEGIGDLETWRLFIQASSVFQTVSPEGNLETERLLREALKRQPESGLVISFLGWVHWQKIPLGISKDPKKDMDVARKFAEKSLLFFDENHDAYSLLATLDMFAGNHESAIAHADRAIELAPTSGYNIAIAGWVKSWSGQPQEALELLKRAMRLDPYHWEWVPDQLAFAHLMLGQYDDARAIYQALLASPADNVQIHPTALRSLAAIAVFEGDMDSARQYSEKLLAIESGARVSSSKLWLSVLKDQAFLERYLDALRKAGLPE